MSYEPTLIISYEDIVRVDLSAPKTVEEQYIVGVIKDTKYVPELKGLKIIVCKPELTSFNKKIRGWLYENDVEFTISD